MNSIKIPIGILRYLLRHSKGMSLNLSLFSFGYYQVGCIIIIQKRFIYSFHHYLWSMLVIVATLLIKLFTGGSDGLVVSSEGFMKCSTGGDPNLLKFIFWLTTPWCKHINCFSSRTHRYYKEKRTDRRVDCFCASF